MPLIHHDAKLLFFNINHITSNDIDILDQIFSEYLMSNYKTTLYESLIFFSPERPEDQKVYELLKSNIVT